MPSDAVRTPLDPKTKVFCALDLTTGYHQVKLIGVNKDMTTFTLLWGCFQYEVLPMGLKPSSDIFNINSDKAVKGLKGTLKSVDGMLTQGRNWGDLRKKMVVLFRWLRHYNIIVKTSKFRVGTQVTFGGFQCKATRGGIGIQPDHQRLEAIAQVQPPQNKTDVRAFLGMVCQMEAWTPDLSFASKHMRQQTMKSTQFIWSDDCHVEFLRIKEVYRTLTSPSRRRDRECPWSR